MTRPVPEIISLTDSTNAVWECFLLTLGLIAYSLNLVPDSALKWHDLPGSTPSDAKLPTIRPGGDRIGDEILRYCEGVREALYRHYLSGVSFGFHGEKDAPNQLSQVFMFSFTYRGTGPNSAGNPVMQMASGSGANPSIVGSSRQVPTLDGVCKTIKRFLMKVEAKLVGAPVWDARPLAVYKKVNSRAARFDIGHHEAAFYAWTASNTAEDTPDQQSSQELPFGLHHDALTEAAIDSDDLQKEEFFAANGQERKARPRSRFAEPSDFDLNGSFPSTLPLSFQSAPQHAYGADNMPSASDGRKAVASGTVDDAAKPIVRLTGTTEKQQPTKRKGKEAKVVEATRGHSRTLRQKMKAQGKRKGK